MTKDQIEEIVTAAMKLHGETSSTFDYRDIVERIGPEIAERVANLAAPPVATCEWRANDEDVYWRTDCGNKNACDFSTPGEEGMKFCCYCGKSLVDVPCLVEVPFEEGGR